MLEKTRRKVWDALNDEPKPEILKGRRITKVKCPVCNSTYAHFSITRLQEELNTKQGGYLLKIDYECECVPPFLTVIAEHKGECVIGQIIDTD